MTKFTGDHRYRESGLEFIVLKEVESYRCDCGERIISIPGMPELNAKIGEILIQKKSPLGGKEIRFLRKNMGLTGKRLSEIMGIDNATISRWEGNLQRPAKTHDHFFRLLYITEKQIPADKVKRIVDLIFPEINQKPSDMPDMVLYPAAWTSSDEYCKADA